MPIQTKTCGYQWHQKVLFEYCGNVREARSDRTIGMTPQALSRTSVFGSLLANPRDFVSMSIEEAIVSNIREIAAIVEVLERKGLCTKQDLYDIIAGFRRKKPGASIPETTLPEPYLLTEIGN